VTVAIRAAFFDFGGVVLSSPFEAFNRYEEANGLPRDLLRTVNATNPDANAWAQLERGQVTFDQFCDLFEAECRDLGHAVSAREMVALLRGDIRPAMVTAIRRCREEGLVVGCLTNNFTGAPDGGPTGEAVTPRGHVEVLDLFDFVLESSKAGVRKPDPHFYELACELARVRPHEAVFLDDLGVNLKPAKAMGMHTIKVVDPADALRDLELVLGLPLG
jgi:putative hydrolase of the HAD superfamily